MAVSSSAESITAKTTSSLSAIGSERVSVVMPCYNEERFIGMALQNLAHQFDNERYEIIVVDGMSEDRTRHVIEEFKRSHPEISVKIVDNPVRSIPAALNLGIARADGDIIVRMDAHAVPSQGYVRRCVDLVCSSEASVVGTPCRVCPGADTLVARAIALAVSHPFGIGDAKYRLRQGKAAQESVDTVAFGAFDKALWHELGGFNEGLLTNEDYDFNYRVRSQGGVVLLDRAEHCDYFARSTLAQLAKQYFRYGGWKVRMIKLHPRSLKLRHLVAPLFVVSIILLALAGLWWKTASWLLALEMATYLLLALLFGWQIARRARGGIAMMLLMPLVFFTIHCAWGGSFLLELLRPKRQQI
jgi:succinoglycan biosynthesis protein ExoA